MYIIVFVQKRSIFLFLNKHAAMSWTSLGSYELSHRVIARDGTWIFIKAMLAEEETMSGADASFWTDRERVSQNHGGDIPLLPIGRKRVLRRNWG
ncbi:hypothetical protein SAMN05421736_101985 [Evansella caseinilytica]|uniref:Uncharacterized protein n=1 Tax=Evansella caseinilytica TaxID=1503961 RepID=A0A1H3J1I9_9BACI|nr:hypothetical protein [Evansella caseinilytica]SDY33455.1 hypothetical protein SAMN05421736_101985 [Evansella caseinilytica]